MNYRRRPSPALVISVIALFVALGGSSIAAVALKKNSVGSTQIKNNSIKSSDVKNKSLLSKDFKSGQLPAGATGPTGARGATGGTGPATASFLTGQIPQPILNPYAGGTVSEYAPSGLTAVTGYEDRAMLSPNRTVVLRDLAVQLRTAPGAGSSRTFRIGVPGDPASPAISCTVSASSTTCNSGNATAIIPPGSVLEMEVENGSPAPAASDAKFGYRAISP